MRKRLSELDSVGPYDIWLRIRDPLKYAFILLCLLTGSKLTREQTGFFIICSVGLVLLVIVFAVNLKNRRKGPALYTRFSPYICHDMPQKPYDGKTFALACRNRPGNAGMIVAGYLKSVGMTQVEQADENTDWAVIDFDDPPAVDAYRLRKCQGGTKQLVYDPAYDYNYATFGKPNTERAFELKQAGSQLIIYSARSLAEHFDLVIPRR